MAHINAEARRQLAAGRNLAEADADMFYDHAGNWSCGEMELIAALFDAYGYRSTAGGLLAAHRDEDQECEGHPEYGIRSYEAWSSDGGGED